MLDWASRNAALPEQQDKILRKLLVATIWRLSGLHLLADNVSRHVSYVRRVQAA